MSLNALARSFLWVGLNDSPCVSSLGTNVRSARRSRGVLAPRGAEGGGRADRSDWQDGVFTDPVGGDPLLAPLFGEAGWRWTMRTPRFAGTGCADISALLVWWPALAFAYEPHVYSHASVLL